MELHFRPFLVAIIKSLTMLFFSVFSSFQRKVFYKRFMDIGEIRTVFVYLPSLFNLDTLKVLFLWLALCFVLTFFACYSRALFQEFHLPFYRNTPAISPDSVVIAVVKSIPPSAHTYIYKVSLIKLSR